MNSGIYLLLGSNVGNKLQNLERARIAIAALPAIILKKSKIYKTAPWGKSNQDHFYNQVLEIRTALDPMQLMNAVLLIENELGRRRKEKWGPRIMDIDILLYQDQLINEPSLQLPHPGIPVRRFTLVPLNEIAPDLIHPGLNKNIRTLLSECTDQLDVMPL